MLLAVGWMALASLCSASIEEELHEVEIIDDLDVSLAAGNLDDVESVAPVKPLKKRLEFFIKNGNFDWDIFSENWWFEAICFGLIIAYLLCYYQGSRENRRLAQQFVSEIHQFCKEQFTETGIHGERVYEESPNVFKYYCSGRRNCISLTATIYLQPRQDVLQYRIANWVMPLAKDRVTLEIILDNLDIFALCLCRKKHSADLQKRFLDLSKLCKPRKVGGLPEQLVCLSDSLDVSETVALKSGVKAFDKAQLQSFQWLYSVCSQDDGALQDFGPRIFGEFELCSLNCIPAYAEVFRMFVGMVDVLSGIRLAPASRAKATAIRQEIRDKMEQEDEASRQERINARRLTKKREMEEKMKHMTPEQQRKQEEKNYRKDLKARMPKMKIQR